MLSEKLKIMYICLMLYSVFITKVFHKLGYNLTKLENQNAETWVIDPKRPYRNPNSCQISDLEAIYNLFADSCPKTFIDVGAFDGFKYSNTWSLSVNNWLGLMVEPDPDSAELCRMNLSKYPNVKVLETAVSNTSSEVLIYRGKELSTTNLDVKNEYKASNWSKGTITDEEITVKCTTLEAIVEDNNFTEVGVLSVDVEGAELSVWKSFNIDKVRPRIMIWELQEITSTNEIMSKNWNQVRSEILETHYKVIYRDRINTVFIDSLALTSQHIL